MRTEAMIAVIQSVFYKTSLTGDEKNALCEVIDALREREYGEYLNLPAVSRFPNGTPRPTVIAVDFDGCLVANRWPMIGEANVRLISRLKALQKKGCALILHTCREDVPLTEAIAFCREIHGLCFDAVNENLPQWKVYFGSNSRKISADYYIDDKAIRITAERSQRALDDQ